MNGLDVMKGLQDAFQLRQHQQQRLLEQLYRTSHDSLHQQRQQQEATAAGGGGQGDKLPALLEAARRDKLLPYGSTLHYPGCSCPEGGNTRGRRASDFVDLLLGKCHKLYREKLLTPNRPLRVAYMLPHHNITGGMKCLVEHIRLLRARGHYTIAVHRSDTAKRAMPPWTTVAADVDVVCDLHQRLSDVYPVQNIDVVVVGIFHQVAELLAGVPAPVLYWEQGHEWVFGDPIRLQTAQNYLQQDQLFHMSMRLPVALATVSDAVTAILQREFGRSTVVIPNGIDCERFQPGPRQPPVAASTAASAVTSAASAAGGADVGWVVRAVPQKTVLIVGNPALPLKGFDTAIAVLAVVDQVVPLKVRWICQQPPTISTCPVLAGCRLDIEYHVSPSQEELPLLYRGHDVFLFTSRYEAWGMPILEAMASGLAVVTTDCLGVRTFGRNGVNCLMAEADDVAGLARQLLRVLTDARLQQSLQVAGRLTAQSYTPQHVLEQLESVLYALTACSTELLQLRHACFADIQAACTWASQACARPPASSAPQRK